jgi:antitoxin (DNA-binding transcriptional repressor) of toxin-antitoxin stability system
LVKSGNPVTIGVAGTVCAVVVAGTVAPVGDGCAVQAVGSVAAMTPSTARERSGRFMGIYFLVEVDSAAPAALC